MRALIVLCSFAISSAAFASPQCTGEPASRWLPEAEMKARIAEAGHKIDVFKVTLGNCYEIYGRNKDGKRIEIYYHPVTGEVIKASQR